MPLHVDGSQALGTAACRVPCIILTTRLASGAPGCPATWLGLLTCMLTDCLACSGGRGGTAAHRAGQPAGGRNKHERAVEQVTQVRLCPG